MFVFGRVGGLIYVEKNYILGGGIFCELVEGLGWVISESVV